MDSLAEEKVKKVINSFNEYLSKNQNNTKLYGEALNAFYQRLRLENLISKSLEINQVVIKFTFSKLEKVKFIDYRNNYCDLEEIFNKLLNNNLDFFPELNTFIYQINYFKIC